jgi:hypothetical protein
MNIDWLAKRSDGLTFLECLEEAFFNRDLVAQFDRLRGTNVYGDVKKLDRMMKEKDPSKKCRSDFRCFAEFVWSDIWERMDSGK